MISLRGGVAMGLSFAAVLGLGLAFGGRELRPSATDAELAAIAADLAAHRAEFEEAADRIANGRDPLPHRRPPRMLESGVGELGEPWLIIAVPSSGPRQALVRMPDAESVPRNGPQPWRVLVERRLDGRWWYADLIRLGGGEAPVTAW